MELIVLTRCKPVDRMVNMTSAPELRDKYFDAVFRAGLKKSGAHAAKGKLRFYLDSLFRDIPFENKTMLDIGGGSGIFSFYAACMGAKRVVCL